MPESVHPFSPIVIEPRRSLLSLDLHGIWRYRDLLMLFVRRDFVSQYTQTILGPLWYLVQPLLTTLTFTVIFGNIAGISTDGLPKILFYLAGITAWNYFADCLTKTADVFKTNEHIFGKVYFPRVVVPLSIVLSHLVKFGIQFLIFLAVYLYFFFSGAPVQPNTAIFLLPFLILLTAGLGLGFGLIISALTTKYRDLAFLITFGIQLLMYATPVIYPLATIPDNYLPFILANPMTSVVETFKYGFFGTGTFSWGLLGYSTGFMVVLLMGSLVIFNHTERTFIDTV